MKREVPQQAAQYTKNHTRKKQWQTAVTCLAAIVVFFTTYALILPAITLEKVPQCGKTEHTHSEACYEQTSAESSIAPVCTLESLGLHQHTAACRDENGGYCCGYSDFVVHQHDSFCYDENGNLWCPLPEIEAHTHSEDCFAAAESANPVHIHTEECYTTEQGELTCTIPEGEGAHAHSAEAGCYDENGQLTCQQEESSGHQHTDGCYAQNRVLICELPTEPAEEPAEPILVCGKPEIILHEHDSNCFDKDDNLICGQVQVLEHPHTDACFETVEGKTTNTLICQLEEHTHSEDCFQKQEEEPAPSDGPVEGEEPAPSDGPVEDEQPEPGAVSAAAEPQLSIQLDTPLDVYVEGQNIVKIPFTPEVTHEYIFSGKGPNYSSIYGYFFNENGTVLQSALSDYYGQLKMTYTMTAGTRYDLGICYYYSGTSGTIPVLLSYGTHYYQPVGDGTYACTCGATTEIISGTCGENVTWSLVDGVLTISGSGRMDDYSYYSDNQPWHLYSDMIQRVVVEEGVTYIGSAAFASCEGLTDVTLPNGLRSIGSYAFARCEGLTGIELPGSVTSIGSNAFYACKGLTGIIIPGSVTSIGEWAFYSCGLTSVTLSEGLRFLGNNAFYSCASLTSVALPESVTSIGSNVFSSCSRLTSVTLPKTMTTIANSMFSSCSSLTGIDLPQGVTSIGSSAFAYCTGLTSVTLPDGLKTIGSSAFRDCTGLSNIVIPGNVTTIGYETFFKCTGLTDVTLPGNLRTIGTHAFCGCTGLTGIDIPESVSSIGDGAFSGCTGLTGIDIPEGVSSIGSDAFYNCPGLETITIPSTVTSMGNTAVCTTSLRTLYWNAVNASVTSGSIYGSGENFRLVLGPNSKLTRAQWEPLRNVGCSGIDLPNGHYLTLSGLKANFLNMPISTLQESLYYVDAQGVMYRVDEATGTAWLAYCPDRLTTYTVPEQIPANDGHGPATVVGVDSYAFYQASTLETLTFESPGTITELKDFAFFNAKNLASINEKSTDTEVLALFPAGAKTGTGLFDNTKIAHTSAATNDALTLEAGKLKVTITTKQGQSHTPAIDEDGTFRFYTGESATTVVSVSNPTDAEVQEGTVLRVYYRMESEHGELNYQPGSYTILTENKNEISMTVSETSLPNCYCLELAHPAAGDTVSLTLTGKYPSPASAGGTATIWGAILTKEEAETLGKGLPPMNSSHTISWETVRDTFPVTKDQITTSPAKLGGDGTGGAYVTGLSYLIKMQRDGQTVEGMGKDHMTSAEFVDVLTLPEEMTVSDAVREAIANRTYTVKYSDPGWEDYAYNFYLPDGTRFLKIQKDGGNQSDSNIQYISLAIGETGNPEIHWTFPNASYLSTEISNVQFQVILGNNFLKIPAVEQDKTYEVRNDVSVTQRFMHTEDVVQTDGCSVTLTPEEGTLALEKQLAGGNANYVTAGSATNMVITLKNPKTGIAPPAHTLRDPMPYRMYMTAGQMAKALLEDRQLSIEISRATLCTLLPDQTVTGMDGVTTGQHIQQDTGVGTRYNGLSNEDPAALETDVGITLVWGEADQLIITRSDGTSTSCEATGAAIQQVLDSWGYLITGKTTYTLTWDLRKNGEPITLAGGAAITKKVDVTFKDSFMHLDADQLGALPSYQWSASVDNVATAYYNETSQLSARGYFRSRQDFSLTKGWSTSGQAIEKETKLEQGMVLDYELTAVHHGTAHYDALPLTDHVSGAQALLVPVSLNENETWAKDCPTVTLKDGSRYYILKNAGTYLRVWTGPDQMADTVSITQTDSGLDTVIKWYFTDYSGERTDKIKYHTMICPQDVMPEGVKTFFVHNETWLGDHESHRLYNTIPGWVGSALSFEKRIVEKVGDQDGGSVYSNLQEGKPVTYRLSMYGVADEDGKYQKITITSADLYDVLPKSIEGWRWDKDKIQITYGENVTVTGEDHWHITDAKNNQQELRWDEGFEMSFTERADIYVTLQFPEDDVWVDYANTYGLSQLINTFHFLGGQVSVTHNLSIQGEVRIQKGVYASGRKGLMGGQTDARWYYSNAEEVTYYVDYYITIYNGGRTNFYLTELQDRLPRGFSGSVSTGNSFSSSYSNGIADVYNEDGTPAKRMAVYYHTTSPKTENGSQFLTFDFFSPSGTWNGTPISYDKERKMSYLKPGEYVVLCYGIKTNKEADTDPVATNVIAMPYYDFNGGGVTLASSRTVVEDAEKYRPNDGGCEIYNAGDVHSLGFTGGESDTQWLVSSVTVQRGGIKPGITKKLVSATDINGKVTQDPVSVNGNDTLKWRIIADNDGAAGLTDYVLTDSMQSPYRFTGIVRLSGYTDYWSADFQPTKSQTLFDRSLFSIESWDDSGVTIKPHERYGYGTAKKVPADGTKQLLSAFLSDDPRWDEDPDPLYVAFSIDDAGNAVMSFYLQDEIWGIPPGGSVVLMLDTRNADNSLANKQFFNTAFITPLSQTWDHTVNKGNYTSYQTLYGDATASVRNSAPVFTSFGFASSAIKQIEEVDDPANRATSNDGRNYIALSDVEHAFTYTLTVNNINDAAMDQLVLIDRLPEVGDHTVFDKNNPRDSQFRVSFADDPGFAVIVTKADGTEETLAPESYTLQFSDKTEFVDDDWNGVGTEWSDTRGSYRTVRLKIFDDTGALIPEKSKVSLRFNCKVDDSAASPGQIAWNAFGYRYSMAGIDATLDAAPLKVGVKVPTVPKLVKKLVDHRGAPLAAESEQSFSFLVYTGEAMTGSWQSAEELKKALTADGRTYREFTAAVSAGASESGVVVLPENDADGWKWKRNQPYTVVELLAEDGDYVFRGFNVATQNAYTFTYDPVADQIITCSNARRIWNVELTKAEPALDSASSDKPLAGAVFGLYSPDSADGIEVPAEYAGLEIAKEIEQDGAKWYLYSVQTSGADGKIIWDELKQARYYLVEIKAPDGYKLPRENIRLLNRGDESQGTLALTVYNYPAGYELPNAGGPGTGLYTMGGLLLTAVAAMLLLYKRKKRGKEDLASS